MSRPIYQYEPNNSNPDRAVGILLPFNRPSNGRNDRQNFTSGSLNGGSLFTQSYTTEQQSISNLKNLLLTAKGERYLQPTFGTDIQKTLFEPNTELIIDDLQLSLKSDIKFWLPYIQLNEINIIRNIDSYSLAIRIRYTVTSAVAERVIIVLANENEIILSEIDDVPLTLVQTGVF